MDSGDEIATCRYCGKLPEFIREKFDDDWTTAMCCTNPDCPSMPITSSFGGHWQEESAIEEWNHICKFGVGKPWGWHGKKIEE